MISKIPRAQWIWILTVLWGPYQAEVVDSFTTLPCPSRASGTKRQYSQSRIARPSRVCLSLARRPVSDDNNDNDDDDNDDDDDNYYYRRKEDPRSRNDVPTPITSASKDTYYDDYGDGDDGGDDDDVEDVFPIRPRPKGAEEEMLTRYRRDDRHAQDDEEEYDDDYYEEEEDDDDDDDGPYDDDEEEDEVDGGGNFWSNPMGGMDRGRKDSPPRRKVQPDLYEPRPRRGSRPRQSWVDDDGSGEDRERRRRRRPVGPNGMAQPPAVARDLYERLFWYGFDPDDSDQVGDRTVFGGTKGKFNGLSYLQAAEMPARRTTSRGRQLLPRPPRQEDDNDETTEDYYNNDEDDDEDSNETVPAIRRDQGMDRQRRQTTATASLKPPNDRPYPRNEERPIRKSDAARSRGRQRSRDPSRPQRRRRRSSYDYDDGDDDDDDDNGVETGGDWVSKQVSSWFSGREEEDDYDEYDSERRTRRRQRATTEKTSGAWSPFNVLDAFLGVDRSELAYKADQYNSKMGIGRPPSSSSSRGRSQSSRRPRKEKVKQRPGYAYRYDPKEDGVDALDEGDKFIVDIAPLTTTAAAADAFDEESNPNSSADGSRSPKGSKTEDVTKPRRAREMSWEERSLAVERVPPADIPGWGPSGELDVDARTKAIMDALEDIQSARQKLETREKKEVLAKEDITILKVDAQLQRRRLEDPRSSGRLSQERLRQIELDIDDASRSLRRARTQVQMAKDQLDELQERHWGLLGFYNPDQAEEKVTEALNELQQLEPAARLVEDPTTTTTTTTSQVPQQEQLQEKSSTSSPDSTPLKAEAMSTSSWDATAGRASDTLP